jgi:hypothetical protein
MAHLQKHNMISRLRNAKAKQADHQEDLQDNLKTNLNPKEKIRI